MTLGLLFLCIPVCNIEQPDELVNLLENWDGYLVEHPYDWAVSTPSEQGMDADRLDDAVEEARMIDYVYSLLVVRNGYLIVEAYFNGAERRFAGRIHSATKSFISALIGIALDHGFIQSLDQKFVEFFPEYEYLSPYFEEKSNITLRHLLSMQAGFPDDASDAFIEQLGRSNNWIEFAFLYPLIAEPGERWAYSSLSSHLLSAVITKATRMSTLEFARAYLFTPLDIIVPFWAQDPQGYYIGGGELCLTPRDMARFGYLYLNNGTIDDQQIIPTEWIDLTTQGYSNCPWPSGEFKNLLYAYHWWIARFNGCDFFMAQGKAGQNIIVIPDLDMVVVMTTKADMGVRESWTQSVATFDFIAEFVISAVIDE